MEPVNPLLSLYNELESKFGKKRLETSSASDIAKKILLYQEGSVGKELLHVKKKPFGWGFFHAVYKFFTRHPEQYTFEKVFAIAEKQFTTIEISDPNRAKFEKVEEILNCLAEHVAEKKPSSTTRRIHWSPPKAPERDDNETQQVAPAPPPRPRPLPALPEVVVPTDPEIQGKISELQRLYHELASLKKIENTHLQPFLERLGVTGKTADIKTLKTASSVDKAISETKQKIAAYKLVSGLQNQAAQFEALQSTANQLQNDPFFGSFCENVFTFGGNLLKEISETSFAPSQGCPFHDEASLEKYKAKQQCILDQYEKGIKALLEVKATLGPIFSTPVADKKTFLQQILGSEKDWKALFAKALGKSWPDIQKSDDYKKLQPHLDQDLLEIEDKAPSHIRNGFWHTLFERQTVLLNSEGLQNYFLDEYVQALVTLCSGITNACSIYSELKSSLETLEKPSYSARALFTKAFTQQRNALHDAVARFQFQVKPAEMQQRIQKIQQEQARLASMQKTLNDGQKRLLEESILFNPIRLSTETTAQEKKLMQEINALNTQASVQTRDLLTAVQGKTSSVERMLQRGRAKEPEPEDSDQDWS